MTSVTGNERDRDVRRRVLTALAARPYFSTVRLADETGIDPAQARAIVDALDGAGHIRRDDGLAWAVTPTGQAQLQRTRRLGAWALLRSRQRQRQPGTRRT